MKARFLLPMQMTSEHNKHPGGAMIVFGILTVLVAANAAWGITSGMTGPFVGFVLYAYIFFLCISRRHFRAGIIGGLAGLAVHLVELFILKTGTLEPSEILFLCLNLVLPVPLIIFSMKLSRAADNGDEK